LHFHSHVDIHPLEKWFSGQLLVAIENEGLRRFEIKAIGQETTPSRRLLLWVFTNDLEFSSSLNPERSRLDPTRGMKIFWKSLEASDMSPTNQLITDSVTLPKEIFDEVYDLLRSSAEVLPTSYAMFKDWKVGILQRFRFLDSQICRKAQT